MPLITPNRFCRHLANLYVVDSSGVPYREKSMLCCAFHFLQAAFSAYLPGCAECDFYEMELGTAGMMRGYMARRCDPYFTLERKIRRYLSMSLSALQVPAQEREQVIAFVAEIDMLAEARKVVDAVLASLSVQFDLKG